MSILVANAQAKGETRITGSSSPVAAWVIPANEELVVAREVEKVLRSFRR